jgi:hypothetical protein
MSVVQLKLPVRIEEGLAFNLGVEKHYGYAFPSGFLCLPLSLVCTPGSINFAVAPASFRQVSGCKKSSLTEMLGIFIGSENPLGNSSAFPNLCRNFKQNISL